MTSRTATIIESFPAFRRARCIAFLAIIAFTITACGNDDPEDAGGGSSFVSSNGAAGGADSSGLSANQPPWISGKPSSRVMAGKAYAFRPGAGDPENDALSFRAINLPRWAAFSTTTGRLSGTPQAQDVGSYRNIDIEVSDGEISSRLGTFTIEVLATAPGSIAVSWIPATQRVDGSPLTNLYGHRIHWGTEPGKYTDSVFVQGEGVTAYVIDNLLPDSYYIAATTVDTNGLESDLSNPVSVTLQ